MAGRYSQLNPGDGYVTHSTEPLRQPFRYGYRVNNEYDDYVAPLAPSRIRTHAQDDSRLWLQRFVPLRRYGQPSQGPIPMPGDMIEMQFQDGVFWAVYIGDGKIVCLIENKVEKIPLPNTCVYKVNNQYDHFLQRERSYEIVDKTLKEVGKMYKKSKASNESFAAKMRYGISLEGPFPVPGDLIEMQYQESVFWAVYIGHGDIVYFIGEKVEKIPLPDKCVCKVNNKYDSFMRSERSYRIVDKTLKEVGKVYKTSEASNESFAAKMRYGISLEGPFPMPGDLIEYQRGFYEHWAVYIGYRYVVHLTGRGIEALSLSASQAIGNFSSLEGTAEVKMDHMESVAKGSRYKVNNYSDRINEPLSPQKIVANALSRVGESRWYHALNANCEHFATEIRHGKSMCDQVVKMNIAVGIVVYIVLIFFQQLLKNLIKACYDHVDEKMKEREFLHGTSSSFPTIKKAKNQVQHDLRSYSERSGLDNAIMYKTNNKR